MTKAILEVEDISHWQIQVANKVPSVSSVRCRRKRLSPSDRRAGVEARVDDLMPVTNIAVPMAGVTRSLLRAFPEEVCRVSR